jgi:hypothetical protein
MRASFRETSTGLADERWIRQLFSTYSTLIGGARGSKMSRIDQIIKWCGGEKFDGLLVFDECHRAKNFQVGEKEGVVVVGLSSP